MLLVNEFYSDFGIVFSGISYCHHNHHLHQRSFLRFNHSNNNNRSVTSSAFVRLTSKVLWLFNIWHLHTNTVPHKWNQNNNYTLHQQEIKIHQNISTQQGEPIQSIRFCKFYRIFSIRTNLTRCDHLFRKWTLVEPKDCSELLQALEVDSQDTLDLTPWINLGGH